MIAIIAEKPSVAREIAKIVGASQKQDGFLAGNGYKVTWAYGHLIELASPAAYGCTGFKRENLPILPATFQYTIRQVDTGKAAKTDPAAVKQLQIIQQVFDSCEEIIVATDAGREGELIFRYIYNYLKCTKPFKRLWISSLTDQAIRKGLENLRPGHEYDRLYLAGKSRSEADWRIGMNATQAITIASGGQGVRSLGRVQTPVLRMICDRYLENKNFVPQKYWQLLLQTEAGGIAFPASGVERFGKQEEAHNTASAVKYSEASLLAAMETAGNEALHPEAHSVIPTFAKGSGTLLLEGKPLTPGVKVDVKNGTHSLTFVPNDCGEVDIQFAVKDKYEISVDAHALFTVEPYPLSFTMDNVSASEVNITVPVTFTLKIDEEQAPEGPYKLTYTADNKGTVKVGEAVFAPGTSKSLNKGTHSLSYTPTATGSHRVVFTLQDMFGQEKSATLNVEAKNAPLEASASVGEVATQVKKAAGFTISASEADYADKFKVKATGTGDGRRSAGNVRTGVQYLRRKYHDGLYVERPGRPYAEFHGRGHLRPVETVQREGEGRLCEHDGRGVGQSYPLRIARRHGNEAFVGSHEAHPFRIQQRSCPPQDFFPFFRVRNLQICQ